MLRHRIGVVLAIAAILPLALIGLGAGIVFGRMIEAKALEVHRGAVLAHVATVDTYLAERLRSLDLLARVHRRAELVDRTQLEAMFNQLQATSDGAFVDLGVIDAAGKHLAYVGPFALEGKGYAQADWFRHVMGHGAYVSDVFLGYRNEPHCVLAIRRQSAEGLWVLRATIDSQRFHQLVNERGASVGTEVFIVNRDGILQTPSRAAAVLQRWSGPVPARTEGLQDSRVATPDGPMLRVTGWLNQDRWLLVVQQDLAVVEAPVHRALARGAAVAAAALLLLGVTTVLATRHLGRQIDWANARRDAMGRELLRSAKLASVGELATGLAHEINNPLAIISAERTNLSDVLGTLSMPDADRTELTGSIDRIRRQVDRCAAITSKLLRFGRKSESTPEPIDVEASVREVVRLMEKQLAVNNVTIAVAIEPGLPRAWADPTELEQVLVNLLTNSIHAMPDGGAIRIEGRPEAAVVVVAVADTGAGIAPEHLDRIFEPFFTTKAPGKGTGLGLAVCHGVLRGWGGTISAASEPGRGTTITLRLPLLDPATAHPSLQRDDKPGPS